MDPDLIKTALSLINATLAGPAEIVARDVVDDMTISTILSVDMDYETAIWTTNSETIPVERYADKEAAMEGHKRWVERAPSLTEVVELGYYQIPAKLIKLERKKSGT